MGKSLLEKPLSLLTEEDIAQITREECRRFLKERGSSLLPFISLPFSALFFYFPPSKSRGVSRLLYATCDGTGMRRPSWNKSQAIQQVISLKALLEDRSDPDYPSASARIARKPRSSSPPPPLLTPPPVRPEIIYSFGRGTKIVLICYVYSIHCFGRLHCLRRLRTRAEAVIRGVYRRGKRIPRRTGEKTLSHLSPPAMCYAFFPSPESRSSRSRATSRPMGIFFPA